jgi:hypothetical protein
MTKTYTPIIHNHFHTQILIRKISSEMLRWIKKIIKKDTDDFANPVETVEAVENVEAVE